MSWWKNALFFIMLIGLFFGHPEFGITQTTGQKSDAVITATQPDTMRKSRDFVNIEGEIELLEINIEAVIEKPRVAILPKRVEPEFGEMEFINRSFENELKKAPEKPMIIDDRLFVPKKIENLKQKLLRKKKESDGK
jgi:hypothetical protein